MALEEWSCIALASLREGRAERSPMMSLVGVQGLGFREWDTPPPPPPENLRLTNKFLNWVWAGFGGCVTLNPKPYTLNPKCYGPYRGYSALRTLGALGASRKKVALGFRSWVWV